MPNLIYLGNYSSTDVYEGDWTSEYSNSLIGASADSDTLNVTWFNYVDYGYDGEIGDNEGGTGDYVGYDAGNGNGYINNYTDSTMTGYVTLTLSDGSTRSVEALIIQQDNGDVFIGDLGNYGNLDNLSISNIEITSITEDCYTGWYTHQTVSNTTIAPLTNQLDGYVEGTGGNDIIDGNYTGDPDGDCIDANDQILAGEGVNDDIVYAGGGDDLVLAGDGDDDVYGGTGNDTLCGQDGDDILRGEGGNDILEGMNGNDLLYGGAGNDRITGDAGNDVAYGGTGDDSITGGSGNDFLLGGDGADNISGGTGDDTLCGQDGDDVLTGGAGNDVLEGMNDNDTLYAGDGNDTAYGDAGNDYIEFGAGDDLVYGGSGNDIIDDVQGAMLTGADTIYGGSGDDTAWAGAGDDSVYGGTGNDFLLGEAGNDLIDGGEGNDTLCGNDGDDVLTGGAGNDLLEGMNDNDILYGGTGDDRIYGDAGNDYAEGGDGDDRIYGGSGNDTLNGNAGDDTINGGSGDDVICGDDADQNIGRVDELTLQWNEVAAAGTSLGASQTYAVGGMNVTVGFTSEDEGAIGQVQNTSMYVEAGENFDPNSGLYLYGLGGEGGVDNTSTTTLNFASGDAAYGDEVQDVSFRINDIDNGNESDDHIDIVTVRAYDADGNEVPVTITAESNQQIINGNTVTGGVEHDAGVTPANQLGSVLFEVEGPVARIEIDYNNGEVTDQRVDVTDINFFTTPSAPIPGEAGNDVLNGGAGDDDIYGKAGDDTITGGAGNDDIYGGSDADVIYGGAGDVVDGGAGGNDYDILDVTGQGPFILTGPDGTGDPIPDSNGNGIDGQLIFVDQDGNPTGEVINFTEIEEIIGDEANMGPDATDDAFTGNEDTATDPIGNVITGDTGFGADSDPNGDTLTVSAVGGDNGAVGTPVAGSDGGLITIDSNGTISFDPNGEFEALGDGETATTTVTYTVDDGNGGTDTATVTITVTGTNDAPTAVADTGATDQDTILDLGNVVAANDTDPEGDTLTVVSVGGADTNVGTPTDGDNGGSFTINADGTASFDPDGDFDGLAAGEEATTEITYTITDPDGATSQTTVTVTVTGTNDGPVAVADTGTTDEDTVTDLGNVTGNDTDPEGDTLTVAEVNGDPANVGQPTDGTDGGSFTINPDGTASFDPDGDFEALGEGETATTSVTYTVTDPSGATSTTTVTVTVTGVNDGPVAVDSAYTVGQDEAAGDTDANAITDDTGAGVDSDPEGDTLTVVAVDGAAGNVGGTVVGDNGGIFTIDANGDVDFDANGEFDGLGEGEEATTTVSYTIADPAGLTSTATVTFTITGSNDGPVAVDDGVTVTEDNDPTDVIANVLGNDTDPDGDTLTVSEVNGDPTAVGTPVDGSTGGLVTINPDGSVTFDPNGDFDDLAEGEETTTTVTYTVTDPDGSTSTATVTITVTGTNDAPTAVADTGATDQDTILDLGNVVAANDTDPEGDTLTVVSVGGADTNVGTPTDGDNGGSFTINADGTASFDPDGDFDGLAAGEEATTEITYTITDPDGATSQTTVTVTVTGTNDGPVATDNSYTAAADVVTDDLGNAVTDDTGAGADSDPEGDTLTVTEVNGDATLVGTPVAGDAGGLVTVNADGSVDFDPNGEFDALDAGETATTSVTYTIDDGNGGTDQATVTITVDGVNDGPDATDNIWTVSLTEAAGDTDGNVVTDDTGAGVDSDPENDTLTVVAVAGVAGNVGTAVAGDAGGLFTINANGTVDFDANGDFDNLGLGQTGETSVTYTIVDEAGNEDTATATFVVTGINDGTVQGTAGDDIINPDIPYVDADGDIVDANDAILPGDTGNDDLIYGFDGNDQISAGDGNDEVYGGADNDVINGNEGDDTLFGDAGDDTVNGGFGDDTIEGGTGNDVVSGQDGDDSIDGGDGDDMVFGGEGNDTLSGGAGNDKIEGSPGDDTLYGGEGDDDLWGGIGNDIVDGGAGNDTVGGGGGDDLLNGNEGDDIIFGGYGDDTANGGFGDDSIEGGAGNDILSGQDGNDTIGGGEGNDMINGGDGNDVLSGGLGDDKIEGSEGDDTMFGGSGNDDLWGGIGNDTVIGGSGDDTVGGGGGDDSIDAGTGNDIVEGGFGDDVINTANLVDPAADYDYPGDDPSENDQFPNNDLDTVYGGAGNDQIFTGDDDDTIFGGSGNDLINAGIDDDSVSGGDGNDIIIGSQGEDVIEGNDGDDIIYGGLEEEVLDLPDAVDPAPDDNRDTIFGGTGNDIIYGRDDDDTIFGGDGTDYIDGGIDDDVIDAGAGDDTVVGGEGNDTIDGRFGDDTIYGGIGEDSISGGVGNDEVYGGDGNDLVRAQSGDDTLFGGSGDDSIQGSSGLDTIFGGTGEDNINSGDGDDTVFGEDGDDEIRANDGNDTIYGGDGDDFIISHSSADQLPDQDYPGDGLPADPDPSDDLDTVFGGAGNDIIRTGDDADIIFGGDGNDSIDGGIDNDTITAGAGEDTVQGGWGSDTIFGGNGGDVVIGGEDPDDSDVDVLDLTGSNVDFITYVDGDPEAGTVTFLDGSTMTFSEIENVIPCFTPGTMIATPQGERLVEELKEGDKVITRDNGIQEIAWVGHKEMSGKQLVQNPHLKPVLIKAGSLGHGLPERDMMVSPNHRVLVASELTQLYFEENEVLAAAKHLVGSDGIHAVDVMSTTYVHFMFERHEVVLSDGAWTESFQPGDYSLKGIGNSQRTEIFELFPELATKSGLEGYQSARRALKKYEAKLLIK